MKPVQKTSPLLTDLYELTMAAAFYDHQMDQPATFSLFLRHDPRRGYFVAAGLASALELLASFRFEDDDIAYLRKTNLFKEPFLDYLRELRFQGDVWAMPEGTLFFPDEPILEVTAPLIQAQILETVLINIMGLHTLIASKAARCVDAARGRTLVEFGLRRTHGDTAGMTAARSTYLVGFDATSNVLAGKHFNIPLAGTMAHSFVQSFESESEAFMAFTQSFPERSILLIDTYDSIQGARRAIQVAKKMRACGSRLIGVRLDSGDLVNLSKQVRHLFDEAGFEELKIFASGSLDEHRVAEALAKGAAIDAFGVGTKIGVSADAPYLDMVYKMVQYADRPVCKLSAGKRTLAGRKQVFRCMDRQKRYKYDIIGLPDETIPQSKPLLGLVVKQGRVVTPIADLPSCRRRFQTEFARLPSAYKALLQPARYPVEVSPNLQKIQPEWMEEVTNDG
jgi:nicotinate phosphoribosyltransferase